MIYKSAEFSQPYAQKGTKRPLSCSQDGNISKKQKKNSNFSTSGMPRNKKWKEWQKISLHLFQHCK